MKADAPLIGAPVMWGEGGGDFNLAGPAAAIPAAASALAAVRERAILDR
jgi:hypothetical protein